MTTLTFDKVLPIDIEKLYKIFTDYENYPNLFPEYYASIRLRSSRNEVSVVEEHLILGSKEFVMMVKHTLDAPSKHEMSVIGGDCKGTSIVETFERTETGTRLSINADFKIGGIFGLKKVLSKNDIKTNYNKIIQDFIKAVS